MTLGPRESEEGEKKKKKTNPDFTRLYRSNREAESLSRNSGKWQLHTPENIQGENRHDRPMNLQTMTKRRKTSDREENEKVKS